MFHSAFAFVKRDFLVAVSYKTAFAAEVVFGVIFKVITFFYIGKVFGGSVNPSLAAYDNNYFAFLLIGVALMDFMYTSLETFDTNIRESQMMGTLEIILLSPIKLSQMLLFSSLWAYIFTTVRFLFYLFWGVVLFDLDVGDGDPFTAVIFLLLSILCFAPLGILSATVIMVFKKGTWFRTLVSGVSVLLGGVVYPLSVLPDWIMGFTYFIPMTHALNGMRHALLSGQNLMVLWEEALFLVVFALIFLPISIAVFQLGVNRCKETGTLTHY